MRRVGAGYPSERVPGRDDRGLIDARPVPVLAADMAGCRRTRVESRRIDTQPLLTGLRAA